MADPSQYLVHPDTGETVVVDPEWVDRAKAKDFTPASEQQIKAYDARVAVAESPVSSALKSVAEQGAEALAPTSLLRGATFLPTQAELTSMLAGYLPEQLGKAVKTYVSLQPDQERAWRQTVAEALEPVTPMGAMIRAGITTPEAIEARREVLGRVPEKVSVLGMDVPVPLVGGAPVTSLLGLGAAVATPAGLARLGKSLSGESLGIKALSAKEAEAAAAANLRALEGTAGPEVVAAQEAMQDASLKTLEAVDAAAARRAVLAKIPGGEKVARTLEKALSVPEEASALNLVNKTVGKPISTAVEARTRSLAALAPGLKSSPMLQEIVAKAVSQGAGSAADMALLSLGVTSQEDILGDHQMTAERALANMGHAIIDGGLLGVVTGGVPAAASASLTKFGQGVRALNKWSETNVLRPVAKMATEAAPESVDALAARRADLGRPVGELLAEEMEAREPLPVAPPSPPSPAVAVESPARIDKSAMELASAVREAKRSMRDMQKAFTPIRAAEERTLIDNYYSYEKIRREQLRRSVELKQQGATAEEMQRAFEEIRSNVDSIPRNRAAEIANEITGRIEALKQVDAGAIPTGTIRAVQGYVEQLKSLAQSRKSPAVVADTAGTIARSLFETAKPAGENVTMTLQEQRANRLAFDAGHQLRDFLIDEEMWGPAAARELGIRVNLTRADAALKNFDSMFSKKQYTAPKKFVYKPDPGKIAKYLERRGTPAATLAEEAVADLRSSMNDLYADMRASERYYQGITGIPELGSKISEMSKAFDAAEQEAISAASSKALEREFAARQAELDALKQLIRDQQSARNAERLDIEDRMRSPSKQMAAVAKTEMERWRVRDQAERQAAEASIKQWHTDEAARQAQIEQQQKAFDDEVKRRSQLTKEEAKRLEKGGDPSLLSVLGKKITPIPSPVRMYKTLAAVEKASKFTEDKARAFVSAVAKMDRASLAALKPPQVSRTMKQEREQYEARAEKLKKITGTAEDMATHLDLLVSPTQDAAPKVSDHVKTVAATAITSLANAVPAPPPNLPPYQRSKWQPTDAQVRAFNRKYEAVADPSSVLYRIAQGDATNDEIKTVNVVYGNLMKDIQRNLIESLGDQKDLTTEQRTMMSKVLGVDVDGAPALGLTAQSVYGSLAQPPPQKQQQMPVSRASKLRVAERSAEYDTAARQNAQLGARRGYGP
jgi:hypothetical protein